MSKHLADLLLDNFYTIGINFKGSSKTYTYKVYAMDKVEVGDKVVVDTTTGLEIVTAVRVDDFADLDLDSNFQYKYIVQVINTTQYLQLCEQYSEVVKTLKEADYNSKKQAKVDTVKEGLTDKIKARLKAAGVSRL